MATYNDLSCNDCDDEGSLLMRQVVMDKLMPLLTDGQVLRILEVGCGHGMYTRQLIRRPDVSAVVAVDIAPKMIAYAEAGIRHEDEDARQKVRFICADISEGQVFDGGEFDLVFAAWVLECAPDRQTLEHMWQTISMNLRTGGRAVIVGQPPKENPRDVIDDWIPDPDSKWELEGGLVRDTDHGVAIPGLRRTDSGRELVVPDFYIKRSVIEESAKKAGMTGIPVWTALASLADPVEKASDSEIPVEGAVLIVIK